jgi:hypothetical protein
MSSFWRSRTAGATTKNSNHKVNKREQKKGKNPTRSLGLHPTSVNSHQAIQHLDSPASGEAGQQESRTTGSRKTGEVGKQGRPASGEAGQQVLIVQLLEKQDRMQAVIASTP